MKSTKALNPRRPMPMRMRENWPRLALVLSVLAPTRQTDAAHTTKMEGLFYSCVVTYFVSLL